MNRRGVGNDQFDTEQLNARMRYEGLCDRYNGGANVDIALWDLVGKACGQPIHKLLGGGGTKSVRTPRWSSFRPRRFATTASALRFSATRWIPRRGCQSARGILSRNALRALGLKQWDFAARREFPIHERIKLQFRVDLFNISNHPNFGPFNSSFQTGNVFFGRATSILNKYLGGQAGAGPQNPLYAPGGPRSGELALKLVF